LTPPAAAADTADALDTSPQQPLRTSTPGGDVLPPARDQPAPRLRARRRRGPRGTGSESQRRAVTCRSSDHAESGRSADHAAAAQNFEDQRWRAAGDGPSHRIIVGRRLTNTISVHLKHTNVYVSI